MRIALLLGANPRSHQTGAVSIVKPGKWRFIGEGVSDSELSIKNHSLQYSIGDETELIVHTGFSVEFTKRGKENSISVFAERI